MKRIALAAVLAALAAPALAAQKTYQVTGPVVDVTADTIVVMKGNEKWEIARTPETKVSGDLKKGDKVTVEYRMTATDIEVKGGAASKKKAGGEK
jgi:opacity protein-like surface antigen